MLRCLNHLGKSPGGWDSWHGWDGWDSWDQQIYRQLED